LVRHPLCSLATIDDEQKPWNVCVEFACDEQLNIFWKSRMDTLHSQYIAVRPDVSICVFSRQSPVGDFGLYFKARAREVADEKQKSYIISYLYKDRELPPASKFSGAAPTRLYMAEVSAVWLNDDSHTKTAADLKTLRAHTWPE
jgi:hypothetical protein